MNKTEKVRAILADACLCSPEVIAPETSLAGDLDIDSFLLMDIVSRVEKEFGVLVPDRALSKIHTVSDIVTYLERQGR